MIAALAFRLKSGNAEAFRHVSYTHLPYFKLWHLLYSFEGDSTPTGDGNLIQKIADLCGFEKDYACLLYTSAEAEKKVEAVRKSLGI